MCVLPQEERETRFKAKMMFSDECVANTKEWVWSDGDHVSENEGTGEVNMDDVDREDIKLSNSVSNVGEHSNNK